MNRLSLLHCTLAASLLVGCTDLPTKLPASSTGPANGKLVLTTQFTDGGYKVSSLVPAYSKSTVNHLQLKLFTVANSTETPATGPNGSSIELDLTNSELDSPITIGQLRPNTTYRIKAFAYRAAGTAAGDLISSSDANSYVDVTVASDDQPTMSTLKVKLIDRFFSGTATSSGVTVTNGGYLSAGSETFGLGSNGALAARVAGNPLETALAGQCAVRIGNYVYQIGGNTPTGLTTEVQRATLASNGVLGAFAKVDGVNLVTARDMARAVVVGNYLYVIGGRDSNVGTNNLIERATINADGTLSTFVNAGTTSTARSGAAVYVSGSYLYLIGGGLSVGASSTVERATINADGSLGTFATVPGQTLNATRAWPATAVIGGYLYLVGGINSVNLASLERAPINVDGTLGAFETVSSTMTVARNAPTAAVIGNYLYAFGGYGPVLQDTIERAPINTDGSIGSFASVELTMSKTRYGHTGLLAGNQYYVFGGDNGSTAYEASVDRFTIN